jgi:predicted metal-dependent hydrolase
MAFPTKHNLLLDPAACSRNEFLETLVVAAGVRLERIVSLGQATAAGEWLKQDTNEWVLLVSGSAKLVFADPLSDITLDPGDHIMIPEGCRHRVEWTDPAQKTVWLALHFPAQKQPGIKDVKVIRTRRRSRSASARMVKDTLYVRVPHRISDEDLQSIVKDFTAKIEKKLLKRQLNSDQGLAARARELNKQYFSGKLRFESIEYVTDQNSKFGCCDYVRGRIRIAHHVAFMPAWVRDYVLVHELAHLVHPDHGPDFWKALAGYKHMERAKGYLLAKGYELNDETEEK